MRRGGLKRRVVPKPFDAEAAAAFRALAYENGCAICHGQTELEVHHLIPKRLLKAEGHVDKLWARENGLVLCRTHHARHESGFARVPASVLPHESWAFAQDIGLDWFLERIYGAEEAA